MTDGTRKDERRNRFERKKKFKKISSSSKLKISKRKDLKLNLYSEAAHEH
tara:strand:+ start:5149 stop:5298 length:150 start_codon:yes stop_codon:yes gene_type:complete